MLSRLRAALPWLPATWVGFLTSALVVGLFTNWIYDVIAKPGLSLLAIFFLNVFTLGSDTLQTLYYESAAKDPTSLPSVLLLTLLTVAASTFVGYDISRFRRRRHEVKICIDLIDNPASRPPPPTDAQIRAELVARYASMRKSEVVLSVIALTGVITLYTSVSVISSSMEIWRTFNANVTICAPHISDVEEEHLRAKFAQIHSKRDYMALESDLAEIAAKHQLFLRRITTW